MIYAEGQKRKEIRRSHDRAPTDQSRLGRRQPRPLQPLVKKGLLSADAIGSEPPSQPIQEASVVTLDISPSIDFGQPPESAERNEVLLPGELNTSGQPPLPVPPFFQPVIEPNSMDSLSDWGLLPFDVSFPAINFHDNVDSNMSLLRTNPAQFLSRWEDPYNISNALENPAVVNNRHELTRHGQVFRKDSNTQLLESSPFHKQHNSSTMEKSQNPEIQDLSHQLTYPVFEVENQVEDQDIIVLPDPYTNSIRHNQNSMLNAALHNARAIGISLHNLLTSKPSSPFYRPINAADDPTALLAAARRPSFPENLQPTLPQILYPHHAFLDLLPFPVLRARAIALAGRNPQIYDSWDLKKDIMLGGLLCWRPERCSDGVGSGSSGQPWDIGSWEVAPWFLKKWRMLMVEDVGDV